MAVIWVRMILLFTDEKTKAHRGCDNPKVTEHIGRRAQTRLQALGP